MPTSRRKLRLLKRSEVLVSPGVLHTNVVYPTCTGGFFAWNSRSWMLLSVFMAVAAFLSTLGLGSTFAYLWGTISSSEQYAERVQIALKLITSVVLLLTLRRLRPLRFARSTGWRVSQHLFLYVESASSSVGLSVVPWVGAGDYTPPLIHSHSSYPRPVSSGNEEASFHDQANEAVRQLLAVQGIQFSPEISSSRNLSCSSQLWKAWARPCRSVRGAVASIQASISRERSFPVHWMSQKGSLMPLGSYDREFVQKILKNGLSSEEVRAFGCDRRGQVSTMYDAFLKSVLTHGYQNCLGSPTMGASGDCPKSTSGIPHYATGSTDPATTSALGSSGFSWLTYDDALSLATFAGSGLLRFGRLVPGDRIGLLIESRQKEWALVDLACLMFSLVSECLFVPGEHSFTTLLSLSMARMYVVDKSWTSLLLNTLANQRRDSDGVVVVQVEPVAYEQQMLAHQLNIKLFDFDFLVEAGKSYPLRHTPPLETETATILFREDVDSEDSGGVTFSPITLSHREVLKRVIRFRKTNVGSLLTTSDIHCSYLPCPHEAERCVIHTAWSIGMSVGFVPFDMDSISTHLRELQPTFLLSTPRLMEALYTHFLKIRSSWTSAYRNLFRHFFLKKSNALPERESLQDRRFLDDMLFFGKLADRAGTNYLKCILVVICGSSNGMLTRPDVTEFVQVALCCPVVHCITSPDSGIYGISRFDSTPVTRQRASLYFFIRSFFPLLSSTLYDSTASASPEKCTGKLSSARKCVIRRAAQGLELTLATDILQGGSVHEGTPGWGMLPDKDVSTACGLTKLRINYLPGENEIVYMGNRSSEILVPTSILLSVAERYAELPHSLRQLLDQNKTLCIPGEYAEMLAQVSCGLLRQVWLQCQRPSLGNDASVRMVGVVDKEQCYQWALKNLAVSGSPEESDPSELTIQTICSAPRTVCHVLSSIQEAGDLLVNDCCIEKELNESYIKGVQCIVGLLLESITDLELTAEPFFAGNSLATPISELNRSKIHGISFSKRS
eukprot:gb/GECG01003328.1/.p1 GENE.gb/GECG01003328.1/~~gb/GECG01003328.1/.p1  ORF type:complete len:1013 (+),score=77.18 gb/GECG01003328.1/:1-3039(+)